MLTITFIENFFCAKDCTKYFHRLSPSINVKILRVYTVVTTITLQISQRPRELNFPGSAGVGDPRCKHQLLCFKLPHYKNINRHVLLKFQKSSEYEALQKLVLSKDAETA